MMQSAITFRLFGGLELIGPDGRDVHAVLAQPKRLALLAYLAVASPHGYHRRDTLLALFWPELDQVHARRALNRAIYFLRSALGDATIVSRGNEEIGVARDQVWCDVRAFAEALARSRFENALNLYRGDLLVGFFLEEVPQFERWLEEQRSALRAQAASAARARTGECEASGNFTPAIGFARRAADYAPDDERALRRLIAILVKAGDRAGALRAYEAFAARLAAELGAVPSVETRSLIERLRAS